MLVLFFLNGPSLASISFIYRPFQTNITNFTTNECEKCPSSIRHQVSNTQPCDYKSPPLTTRPLECYSYLIDAGEFHLVEDWDEEVADDDQRETGRQEPREWEQPTMVGYFSRYTYIGQVGRSSDTFSTILS